MKTQIHLLLPRASPMWTVRFLYHIVFEQFRRTRCRRFVFCTGSRRPELATVDLGQRLNLSDDRDDIRRKNDRLEEVEDKSKELLELVKQACTGDGIGQTVEKLLLDFFREAAAAEGEEEAVMAAVEWAERGGEEAERWWEEESLAAEVREMEEDGRRRAAEEAAAVAAAVEGGVLESLMEELVAGLRLR